MKKKISIAAVFLLIFITITILVMTKNTSFIDDAIRFKIYDIRNDKLTAIVKVITYMGNWQTITIICLILLTIKKSRVLYGIPLAAGTIAVTVLNNILKVVIKRPRPDDIIHLVEETSYSFPSGHSITSMFVYGMLIYLVYCNMQNRRCRCAAIIILCIPAFAVGLSRIYLGVHYPTDVLAGWSLAITLICVTTALFRIFSSRSVKEDALRRS